MTILTLFLLVVAVSGGYLYRDGRPVRVHMPEIQPGQTTADAPGWIHIPRVEQLLGNVTVDIYISESKPVAGAQLAGQVVKALTNENGELQDLTIGPLPRGRYWVIVDYGDDGIYVPELDAVAELEASHQNRPKHLQDN